MCLESNLAGAHKLAGRFLSALNWRPPAPIRHVAKQSKASRLRLGIGSSLWYAWRRPLLTLMSGGLVFARLLGAQPVAAQRQIEIDWQREIAPLAPIWASTHFDPARQVFEPAMRQNLLLLGAVPHRGIEFIKIHDMLDLVSAEGLETENPRYDWSRLDAAMDLVHQSGMKHFLELMGNPSKHFNNWQDDRKLQAWRRLVRDLAQRYMQRYGRTEVESWYFATWNEPEAWKPEDFNNYYDACSEGLRAANPRLRFGGPGTFVTLSPVLRSLLRHCESGTNYFTREQGVRLDFISVHEKAVKSRRDKDKNPDTRVIVSRSLEAVEYIRREHPRFRQLPFINDEADAQAGWNIPKTWRAGAYYPAIIAKILNQQLLELVDKERVNYPMLEHCNAFIGDWETQTMLALFGDPKGNDFAQVKKPVLNLYTMLSLLGDQRLRVPGEPMDNLGVLATRRGEDQVAVLLYHCADDPAARGAATIQLQLRGVPFTDAILVRYRIDDLQAHPYRLWQEMGSPKLPTREQIAALRTRQELALATPPQEVTLSEGKLSLEFELPMPGVQLALLSRKPRRGPGPVGGLRLEQFGDEILLRWDGLPSRVLRTYEVLLAGRRINAPDSLDTAFLAPNQPGQYSVRAVDYWGRIGTVSNSVKHVGTNATTPAAIPRSEKIR